LASLLESLTRTPALPDMLDQAAAWFAQRWQADGALIWQVVPGGEIVAMAGYPPDLPDLGAVRIPVGSGVVGRVAADAVPVALIDDSPRNLAHRRLLGLSTGAVVSRLCVPARLPSGAVVAVVALHQRTRRAFTGDETDLCQRAADLLALRIGLDTAAASEAAQLAARDGLVAATVNAQETERRRVAADLHDGVSQAIAGLTFHLSAAVAALADDDTDYAREQVGAARALADLAMGETRAAITGLHSPVIDDLGLAAGLASMARVIPNLDIEVAADDVELSAAVTASLFRIAQEAVQNVVKHANARHAWIQLASRGASVVLLISDDGDGFVAPVGDGVSAGAAAGHYGLAGMAERARLIDGRLFVRSAPGEGTTIEVTVPI
ncbi:MAG: GAF domain-containing sensor histidine kinase, partial [Propionibacteriaceae bacterium]|nr:GAF domain-containing sensor histidine kinase [Propionibacteriaceae bacterium]